MRNGSNRSFKQVSSYVTTKVTIRHDSSRFVTMVRGVRFRLIYLYLLQVRDAARDAAARFPNIFLHRDIIEMLTTYKH